MNRTKAALCLKGGRYPLTLDRYSFSYPVLRVSSSGAIVELDKLRKAPGAVIETNNPAACCRALGIPCPDRQVKGGAL